MSVRGGQGLFGLEIELVIFLFYYWKQDILR